MGAAWAYLYLANLYRVPGSIATASVVHEPPHIGLLVSVDMPVDLCYQRGDGVRDNGPKARDGLLCKDVCKELPLGLMFGLDLHVGHVPEVACPAVVPSVFEHPRTMSVNINHDICAQNGDVVWCDTDMATELLVRTVDGEVVLVLKLVPNAP